MPDKIRCPFCNFETAYPEKGRVYDCEGECFSTYTLIEKNDDRTRIKVRLVEIFFLDSEFNMRVNQEEIDNSCEFIAIPLHDPGKMAFFARERRVLEDEIEKIKKASETEIEIGVDTLERLSYSMERFMRNLTINGYPRKRLLNEAKVIETMMRIIREKIELSL